MTTSSPLYSAEPSLKHMFNHYQWEIDVDPACITVQDSRNMTNQQIVEIAAKAGFCAIVSEFTRDGNRVFTICPLRKPTQIEAMSSYRLNVEPYA